MILLQVYISAAFAIVAGKYRSRGFIIAHMVLAIIGAVFVFGFVGTAAGAVAYDGLGHKRRDANNIDQVTCVYLCVGCVCACVCVCMRLCFL